MKVEQEQRFDLLTNNAVSSPTAAKGNITRGSVPQKSLRGGGGGGRSFYNGGVELAAKSVDLQERDDSTALAAAVNPASGLSAASNTPANRSSSGSVFSRLLGQRS